MNSAASSKATSYEDKGKSSLVLEGEDHGTGEALGSQPGRIPRGIGIGMLGRLLTELGIPSSSLFQKWRSKAEIYKQDAKGWTDERESEGVIVPKMTMTTQHCLGKDGRSQYPTSFMCLKEVRVSECQENG